MTDLETGIQTTGQESRSRAQNLKSAFRRMVEKLKSWYADRDVHEMRHLPTPASFGTQTTRSYDVEHDRVTDHVTGEKYSWKHTKDDFGKVIEDRKRRLEQQEQEKSLCHQKEQC